MPAQKLTPQRTMPETNRGIPKAELGPDVSTLRFLRKDPIILYGLLVELVRQIYSADVSSTVPGTWVWDPDRNKSQIWIDTEYRYADENPEHNPAIFISLQQILYASYTGQTKGLAGMSLEEGEYVYQRVAKGTANLIHIGNTKGEGVLIAANTFNYIDAFADTIRKEFCFDKFYLGGFNPMQVVKEEREKFQSVVTVAFEFQEQFTVKMESPKLKRLVIDAGQRVLNMLGSDT